MRGRAPCVCDAVERVLVPFERVDQVARVGIVDEHARAHRGEQLQAVGREGQVVHHALDAIALGHAVRPRHRRFLHARSNARDKTEWSALDNAAGSQISILFPGNFH
eukprot:6199177-Pleurochrysis_carterae.AAC.4